MKANKTRFGVSLGEGWEFHRTFHLEVKRAVDRVCTWEKCVYISFIVPRLASRSPEPRWEFCWLLVQGGGRERPCLIGECGNQPETWIVQLLVERAMKEGEIVCIQLGFHWTLLTLFQVPWSSGLFWLCCRAVIVLPRLSGTGGQHQKTWRSRHWSEHSKFVVCRLCTEKKFFFYCYYYYLIKYD